ncbi:Flp family type IVb pilin [Methylobacterium sp. WL30]|jgi:pilus assembly protein Flp/PilA|uniref:Flp family type IVb pilin n=1 Tax=unclassified Methylobacterium TaxID=2615210 RepID=UPI0011C83007|nr:MULTISPECIES: Flp family type IVb pilin [unclassified Methylobacterium]MCJ2005755.1 Flp family type IVb pilin [Methylobacterium sp. J-092]MCJ2075357.1 Flp family type IVb pilin [Methylobacterium sp. E-016]MCJ2109761.1 Flp family type IVb pilin [Methylobacterium sp. E-025]TXM90050.1 Flp family type IVb pilin [Methylobacterium sp. WL116]TXN39549.1 Flp family type IVb pilin [Methylobacterium sp. WL93]
MSRTAVELSKGAGAVPPKRRFAADARGATSIEYALISGLVFLAIVGSLRLYASKVSTVYQTIGNAVSQN